MDTTPRSFGAQALHYFHRPHDGAAPGEVAGAAAWRGPDVAGRDDWIERFGDDDVAEIETAARACAGLPLDRIGRENFLRRAA